MKTRAGWFAWTEEAMARLRGFHSEGYSFRQIGQEIGCSRNAAIGKAHRLKLEPRANPVHKRTNGSAHKVRPMPKRSLRRVNGPGNDLGGGLMSSIRSKLQPFPGLEPRPSDKHEPQSLELTILEVTDATCRWPHGDSAPFAFCGHQTYDLAPYCPYHERKSRTQVGRAVTEAEREAKQRHARRGRRSNFGFVPAMQRANA